MKNILLVIVMFLAIFVLIVIDSPSGRVYDCGMAEWHPDIPNSVKEECRKIRKNKLIST